MSRFPIKCDTLCNAMEWLNTLMNRLPSWKGITEFFYVASHWGEISHEREEFRHQIKDREDWIKAQEQNLKTIHEQEKQALIAKSHEQFLKAMDVSRKFLDLYFTVLTRLTIVYYLNPLAWILDRERLEPELRQEIEKRMSKLPPPPGLAILSKFMPSLLSSPPVGPLAGDEKEKP